MTIRMAGKRWAFSTVSPSELSYSLCTLCSSRVDTCFARHKISVSPEECELDEGVEKLDGEGEMPHGADSEYVVV